MSRNYTYLPIFESVLMQGILISILQFVVQLFGDTTRREQQFPGVVRHRFCIERDNAVSMGASRSSYRVRN